MGTTIRLPEALQDRAAAYAESVGVSLAGLVGIALADYLDARPDPVADASAIPAGRVQESVGEPLLRMTRQERRAAERAAAKRR